MEQTDFATFLAFIVLLMFLFIGGILMFTIQYYRRRVIYDKEKAMIADTHHRELLQAQVQIQEQTMHDIGRDIHDNVGQKLTLASIYANQLIANKDLGNEHVASIRSIINESLAELRSLSKSLVSTDTDSNDLHATLIQECGRVNDLHICEVRLDFTEASFSISATVKNFIVRIVQEFLQNSLKHSGCETIKVKIGFTGNGLTLVCSDDGRGFDPDQEAAGIGLKNMRSRASLINATFSMESSIGRGTKMQLDIHFDKLNFH
jgi:signal transduction histidine kinase